MWSLAKEEVAKAKKKTYDELCERLNSREGEKDLYRLAWQRDSAGRDVQHVRMIMDTEGNILTREENVLRRWKEYFEELINMENVRGRRLEEVKTADQVVRGISKEEVRTAINKTKVGNVVGPDSIPMEAWRSLEELAVTWFTRLFNKFLKDLEKVYDTVPREELWYCIKKSGVAEKYVKVVKDMHNESETGVRCAARMTEGSCLQW
ncbi:uncharacterized protein [Penaeus vannamei]|uniref:uncharacterized protein n=1 Tax=Penaeus vannamei TaxID=6689 RepID=UPI00387F5250